MQDRKKNFAEVRLSNSADRKGQNPRDGFADNPLCLVHWAKDLPFVDVSDQGPFFDSHFYCGRHRNGAQSVPFPPQIGDSWRWRRADSSAWCAAEPTGTDPP